jgi:hypothetical protein
MATGKYPPGGVVSSDERDDEAMRQQCRSGTRKYKLALRDAGYLLDIDDAMSEMASLTAIPSKPLREQH